MQLTLSSMLANVIEQHMASGVYPTVEDLLFDALDALREYNETVSDLQEAVDGMEAGEIGVPVDEALAELRKKYGIPD